MAEPARLLVRGGTIVGLDSASTDRRADVLVVGPRIHQVAPGLDSAGASVIDASGCYVIPGLVQTHLHLIDTLMRGAAEGLGISDWLQRVFPLEASLDEETVRASVRLGLHELLMSGTTTFLDMLTSHSGDVAAEEFMASGLRARFGLSLADQGDLPAPMLQRASEALAESAKLRNRWQGAGSGRLGCVYAPRGVHACSPELLEAVGDASRESGALITMHVNTTADEGVWVRERTGRSSIEYLRRLGLVGERSILVHAVHVDDDEVRILAQTHAFVAHCPSSNLKLGAGMANLPRLLAAGVAVSIGCDNAAVSNLLDALQEARLAVLLARGQAGATALSARAALSIATRGGAQALHLDDVGVVQRGFRADLIVLDAGRLAPGGDPATRIIFGGGSRAVRDVIVDGEVLVRDGRPTRYDPNEVLAYAVEARSALRSRSATPAWW